MRWAGHVACIEGMKNAFSLVGKAGGNTPLGNPKHGCGDNIIIDLQ
jgi:hypothetical protein